MLKVGITGGIGSGKTIICKIFNRLGVPFYASDIEAKYIISNNAQVKQAIQKFFGAEVYDSQGNLERKKVAELVFSDKSKLEKLNSIVHPEVQRHFQHWLLLHKDYPYILKEAAILFESGSYKELDFIITVVAPEALRINRVIKRDAVNANVFERVMKNQMSDEEKIKKSNYVIMNDEQELVIPQVLKIHADLCGK